MYHYSLNTNKIAHLNVKIVSHLKKNWYMMELPSHFRKDILCLKYCLWNTPGPVVPGEPSVGPEVAEIVDERCQRNFMAGNCMPHDYACQSTFKLQFLCQLRKLYSREIYNRKIELYLVLLFQEKLLPQLDQKWL